MGHDLQAYRNMEMTRKHINFTLDPRDILLSLHMASALLELQWIAPSLRESLVSPPLKVFQKGIIANSSVVPGQPSKVMGLNKIE